MVSPVIVLDTSFLVSFYLSEDVNHEKALELAEQNAKETMLLSDVILFEMLTVLNYKAGIARAREAHDELLGNRSIRFFYLSEIEKDEILGLFFAQGKSRLSYADVSVAYMAKRGKAKVLTFDEIILKLMKQSK